MCMAGPRGDPVDIHVAWANGGLEYKSLASCGPDNPHASKASLINVNSMNTLMNMNKEALLCQEGCSMINSIVSGSAIDSPGLLIMGVLLCFADVKAFQYYFWNACVRLSVPLGVAREIGPVELLRNDRYLMIAIWKGVARFVLNSAKTLPQTSTTTLLPPVVGVIRDGNGDYQVVSLRQVWETRYDQGATS